MLNYITKIINESLDKGLPVNTYYHYNKDYDIVETLLKEGGTYRIYSHLKEDDKWAIISPYRSNRTKQENETKMRELKSDVRGMGYGYTELKSVWSETDIETGKVIRSNEYSLLIYDMDVATAIRLGEKYEQSSILVKNDNTVAEICTTPFETWDGKNMSKGDVVRTFDVSGKEVLNVKMADNIISGKEDGSVSVPTQGNSKPFTLKSESILESVYEVEPPRASYFRNKEIYIPIYNYKK